MAIIPKRSKLVIKQHKHPPSEVKSLFVVKAYNVKDNVIPKVISAAIIIIFAPY